MNKNEYRKDFSFSIFIFLFIKIQILLSFLQEKCLIQKKIITLQCIFKIKK